MESLTACPLIIDGAAVAGDGTFTVFDKFTGEPIAEVARASRAHVAAAVRAAADAFAARKIAPYDRYTILHKTAQLVESRKDQIVETIVSESGFTATDAAAEVSRTIQTLQVSAEE